MSDVARVAPPLLSPDKRKLLARLLDKKGIRLSPPPIGRRSDDGPAPLSFVQEGLWFLEQLNPGRSVYSVPGAVRLTGPLRVTCLEKSLSEIVRRHESLRTVFTVQDGAPLQVIHPSRPLNLPIVDLAATPPSERHQEALRLATEEARTPFDLIRGPLFRSLLLRLTREDHVLVVNMHHLVTDGWSMGVFTRELVELYGAFSDGRPSPLPELLLQYADFAVWQRAWLRGETLEKLLGYWKRQLTGAPTFLELPTDRPRPAFQACRGAHQRLTLPRPLGVALRRLSQREGVTLFVILLAAFKVLLHSYSRQDDLVVGSPDASRGRSELEPLIGYFVNMLALRTQLSGNPSFREVVSRVNDVVMQAHAHQDLPFGKLVEELQCKRDTSRNPVFQVEFALLTPDLAPPVYGYGFRSPVNETLRFSDLTLTPVDVESGVAKFDLVVLLWDTPDGIGGTFEYDADLFDPATVVDMMETYATLLSQVVAQPDTSLQALSDRLTVTRRRHQPTEEGDRRESNRRKLRNAERKPLLLTS